MAAAAATPLTGVGWAAAPEAAPAGWTAITVTVEGAAANLGKGFGHKGGGYLCVSGGGAQAAPGPVVTDVQVLSDRSPQPTGYTRAPEFPEPRIGVSRKKRVYVKLVPLDAAETAVFDIQLSSKSKALPHYMKIGSPAARCSIKRASQHPSLYDTSNIYGLSAMDGVPFTLHPKFESRLISGTNVFLTDLNVKSLADIEKEYNYAFVVERTAAARLPPSIC
ncbi:multivesicular body subunit 12A isoform X4 [Falco rusticolus]|uniref:multivesicular body subunit 12A isoform X4 n=1 Tax=Falco rusticolus TaxID=120794 RepID=UPI00188693EE|nr:multivesicular body subunit 12A isoform X4 [Falco rusticolus]